MESPEYVRVQRTAQFVNSTQSLERFVQDLCYRVHNDNRSAQNTVLYIDLKGVNACPHASDCRRGSLCRYADCSIIGGMTLMTILIREHRRDFGFKRRAQIHVVEHIYVLDIKTLGSAAFSTNAPDYGEKNVGSGDLGFSSISSRSDEKCASMNSTGSPLVEINTLKNLLESPDVSKVLFDLRPDAYNLLNHFGIRLRGALDLQLLENFKRYHCGEDNILYVRGLARCINLHLRRNPDQKQAWDYSNKKGVRLAPLNGDNISYCVKLVSCLVDMWQFYSESFPRSCSDWQREIGIATTMRVKEARPASYDPSYSDAKWIAPSWKPSLTSEKEARLTRGTVRSGWWGTGYMVLENLLRTTTRHLLPKRHVEGRFKATEDIEKEQLVY